MALFTANTNGQWGSATTWSGAGIPTVGDSGVINTSITVTIVSGYTANIGATGQATGFVALTIANGGKLVVGSGGGGNLNLYGDISLTQGSTNPTGILMNPGASIVFKPYANQRVKMAFGNQKSIYIDGSSSNRCSISTDLSATGLNGCLSLPGGGAVGITCISSALNCDFIDIDDGSTTGAFKASIATSGIPVIISGCNFIRSGGITCNFSGPTWNNNCIIANNICTSSVGTNYGNGRVNLNISNLPQSGGSRIIYGNYLDRGMQLSDGRGFDITYNTIYTTGGKPVIGTSQVFGNKWNSFDNNVIASDDDLSANLLSAFGNITNCILLNGKQANAHYISTFPSGDISNNIFENYNTSNDGAGDAIIHSVTNTGTVVNVKFNLMIPTYNTNTCPGIITVMYNSVPSSIVIEHNTIYCGSQHGIQIAESAGNMASGAISSIMGNLFWQNTSTNKKAKVFDVGGSPHTTDMINPNNVDVNGSFNIDTSIPWPASAYTNTGRGYNANFSSVPGANDLSDQDPLFTNSGVCVSRWWVETQGGTAVSLYADTVNAIKYMSTNPTVLIPSCRSWIQSGFIPRNANYRSKTTSLDSLRNYTVDPLNNSINGTIGALGMTSATNSVYLISLINNGIGVNLLNISKSNS